MIVDDFLSIRRELNRIGAKTITGEAFDVKLRCAIREGKTISECQCYKAGPNGSHLPCPPEGAT